MSSVHPESLLAEVAALPSLPGVYRYFDADDQVLYVGKARNLKKRVSSYFQKDHGGTRIGHMVGKIARMETTVVRSEAEALLLENNLIKKLQPRYNVLLRDDKTYPWLCIKNEPFSRVFSTRRLIKDGSEYFGPYTNMKTVMTLLGLVRTLYPLRSCKFDLSDEKIVAGKYKVCLEYHMGNCLAPCTKQIETEDYDNNIKAIREIIKGNFKDSIQGFKRQMDSFATAMEFEKAQVVKEKIESLTNYQAKSTIVSPKLIM